MSESDTPSTLSSRLVHSRILKNLSKTELAQRLGMETKIINRWERGVKPQAHNLIKLTEALEVDSEWLEWGTTSSHLGLPTIPIGDIPMQKTTTGGSQLQHRIKFAREAAGMNLEVFSKQMKMPMEFVQDIEIGGATVTKVQMMKVSEITGVSPTWLDTGRGECHPPMEFTQKEKDLVLGLRKVNSADTLTVVMDFLECLRAKNEEAEELFNLSFDPNETPDEGDEEMSARGG